MHSEPSLELVFPYIITGYSHWSLDFYVSSSARLLIRRAEVEPVRKAVSPASPSVLISWPEVESLRKAIIPSPQSMLIIRTKVKAV